MKRVRDGWLWLIKRTLNRATLRMARAGRGPFSIVRHVGRRSGAIYETPIVVARVPAGFVAELTYGPDVNWYRNIVAAGGCELLVLFYGATSANLQIQAAGTTIAWVVSIGRVWLCFVAVGVLGQVLNGLVLTLLRREDFRLLREAEDG